MQYNGRWWWKNLLLIPWAHERPGKHGCAMLEPLSYQKFCRVCVHTFPSRTSGPLTSSRCFSWTPHPSQLHTTRQQASDPPGFGMLDSRHTQPCPLPQTNVSPACSARILLSVFSLLWFPHNKAHQAAFRSPIWSVLQGAQQSALSSCPWPTWPSSMNGPEWEMMATLLTANGEWRKRKKKKAKPNIPAELRFWFA